MTNSAAPGAERTSAIKEEKKKESKSEDSNQNNRFNLMNPGGFNGFGVGGGGGGGFQLPMFPQLQYNQGVGNHVCCEHNPSQVTEVDSSKFLSAIVGKFSEVVFICILLGCRS